MPFNTRLFQRILGLSGTSFSEPFDSVKLSQNSQLGIFPSSARLFWMPGAGVGESDVLRSRAFQSIGPEMAFLRPDVGVTSRSRN